MNEEIKTIFNEMAKVKTQSGKAACWDKIASRADKNHIDDMVEIFKDPEYEKECYKAFGTTKKISLLYDLLWLKDESIFEKMSFLLEGDDRHFKGIFARLCAAAARPFAVPYVRKQLLGFADQEVIGDTIDGLFKAYENIDLLSGNFKGKTTAILKEFLLTRWDFDFVVTKKGLAVLKMYSAVEHSKIRNEVEEKLRSYKFADEYYYLGEANYAWGDYGSVLVNGISWNKRDEDSKKPIQIERTGPFVPPITFPSMGDIVVTDDFKKKLAKSGLTGLSFKKTVLTKAVGINWHEWDRNADPLKYPAGGEPENYILRRKDEPLLHKTIGKLWQLRLKYSAKYEGYDFINFMPLGKPVYNSVNIASKKACKWLRENAWEWVTYRRIDALRKKQYDKM